VTRLIKGVFKRRGTSNESFSQLLEYPHIQAQILINLKVPPILLSGTHEEIKSWRNITSFKLLKNFVPIY